MFLRHVNVTLLLVLWFFCGASVAYEDDRWMYWDVARRSMSMDDDGQIPLDLGSTNLAEFTAIDIKNFYGPLNVGQLEANFPNVTTLRLRHCDVATINKAFAGKTVSNVRTLVIWPDGRTVCPNVVDVAPVFSAIIALPQLERFEMWGHKLKTIPRRFLPSLNLKAIRIEGAGLERLPNDFFSDYKALEEISLRSSTLGSLHVTEFAGNVNLKILHLRDNRLTELPVQIFQRNVKLRELEMGFNQIHSLHEGLLTHLKDLEEFDVDGNEIDAIPPRFFAGNRKLREVNFDGNRIQRLSPKMFEGLMELQKVWFERNQLKSLGAGLFKDCSKLTKMRFRRNQIDKISPDAFHEAVPLEYAMFSPIPCSPGSPHDADSSDISQCVANWQQTSDALVSDRSSCATLSGSTFAVGLTAPAPRRKYPWSAALFFDGKFQCGASLITSKHILTAAHCYQDNGRPKPTSADQDKFSVAFGRNDFTDAEELPDSKTRKIAEFFLHPDWDATSFNYDGDLAIGLLKNAINAFSDLIRPICLNEKVIGTLYGKQGKVVGWGSTDEVYGSGSSNIALEFKVTIVSDEVCEGHTDYLTALTSGTAFCAGNLTRSAACRGDSGGALFVLDRLDGKKFKAVGIVSAGLPDLDGGRQCDINNYQLYTDVAHYRTWIENILIENY